MTTHLFSAVTCEGPLVYLPDKMSCVKIGESQGFFRASCTHYMTLQDISTYDILQTIKHSKQIGFLFTEIDRQQITRGVLKIEQF